MAGMFASVKRMVRGVSDFRVDKTSCLRRSSEELCYPRATSLENAPEEKVWVSKWDWGLVDCRWHLTSNQVEWVSCGFKGKCCRVGEVYRPPQSGWNY